MRFLLPGYTTWILGLVAMHAIDVALTAYGLWHVQVVEWNPVGLVLWQVAGVAGLALGKLATMAIFLLMLIAAQEFHEIRTVRWSVRGFTAVSLGLGIAVAVHNAGMLLGPAVA